MNDKENEYGDFRRISCIDSKKQADIDLSEVPPTPSLALDSCR